MAIALDTLAYARRLREVGLSAEQAEGQAVAFAAAMSDSLATKQDLSEVESRLDARFAWVDIRFAEFERRLEMRLDLRLAEQDARNERRFADLERRLTVRMGGMMVATVGAVSALARLL